MREMKLGDIRWIDIDKLVPEEVYALAEAFPFHRLNLEDCLSKFQVTKIERHKDYLFVILHFPVRHKGVGYVSLRISFFLSKDCIVTVHDGSISVIGELFEKFTDTFELEGKPPVFGVGYLFYNIIHPIIKGQFLLMEEFINRLETLKESVFSPRKEALTDIADLRSEVSDLRRILHPLRTTAHRFKEEVEHLTDKDVSIYHNDVLDHIEKLWEIYEDSRDTVEIYKDTDFTLYQRRTNQVLIILTMIFTLTIPMALISSLYGMNINLPGGIETGAWTFLGAYTTFYVLLAISLTPAISMLLYFRKLGWI